MTTEPKDKPQMQSMVVRIPKEEFVGRLHHQDGLREAWPFGTGLEHQHLRAVNLLGYPSAVELVFEREPGRRLTAPRPGSDETMSEPARSTLVSQLTAEIKKLAEENSKLRIETLEEHALRLFPRLNKIELVETRVVGGNVGKITLDFPVPGEWQSELPAKPGWYWGRRKGCCAFVVELIRIMDKLVAAKPGLSLGAEEWIEMDRFSDHEWWSVPIEPPKDGA